MASVTLFSSEDPNVLYDEHGNTFRRSPLRRIAPNMDSDSDMETHDKNDKHEHQQLHQSQTNINLPDTGAEKYITVKRKRSPKSAKNIPNGKQVRVDTPPATQNRFELLESKNEEHLPKNEKPTPFYIRGELNTREIWKWMETLNIKDYYIKVLRKGNEAKLQLSTIADYKIAQRYFLNEKVPCYTYQLKSARAIQAVIKGLDPRTKSEDIMNELKDLKFNPRAVNVIRNRRKEATSMFIVDLEPETEKKKGHHPIFDVTRLLHMVVKIDAPIKSNQPKQCYNCQEFGHTKNMCNLAAICVICAERHKSSECTKNKEDPSARKCNNCGKNHTANYKGCVIYQEFSDRVNPKQRREQRVAKNQQKLRANDERDASVKPGLSYAQVATKNVVDNSEMASGPNDILKLILMMQANMNAMQENISTMMKKQNSFEDIVNSMSKMMNTLVNKK